MRYIELNPVRTRMVVDPADYLWSSHLVNALGQASDLIEPHEEYRRLGATAEARQAAYRGLFKHSLTDIRQATNKAWVLGNDRFKKHIQEQLNRRVEPKPRGGDRKSPEYKRKFA